MLTYNWNTGSYIDEDGNEVNNEDAMKQLKELSETGFQGNDPNGNGGGKSKEKGSKNSKDDKNNGNDKEEIKKIIETTANTLGTVEVATDLTVNGIAGAQQLANKIGPRSYEVIKIGEKTLIKGFTVDALGRQVAIVGLVVTGAHMVNNGVNWKNGTDLAVGLASFSVPGIGWVIGAVYFIADPIVTHYTGKGIGAHLGDGVESTKKVSKSLYDQFKSGLSNLESWLRSLGPR